MSTDVPRAARILAAWVWLGAAVVPAAGAQPPDQTALQQRAAQGERALAEGRYAEAEAAYEALRKMSPGTAEVHARLGLIYFQEGKFAAAIPALRQAMALNPGLPKVETLLAMSLSELGRYSEALPALTRGFKQSADPVLRRLAGLHLERAYTGLGRDRDAVQVALELSRLHPDDPEVLYHSGRLFANFAYLQTMRLADVAPESVWMHQAAGEANESQGLYEAALREYRQVLALAPRRPGINFRIGRTLLARSRAAASGDPATPEAVAAFEAELQVDSTNANAAYELGEIHRKAADLDKAREFFELALSHYPEFEDALVGLGRTLAALGQPEKALAPLETATKLNPGNDVAFYQLAQVYRALGRTVEQEQALATFTRLREGGSKGASLLTDPRREVTRQELDLQPPKR